MTRKGRASKAPKEGAENFFIELGLSARAAQGPLKAGFSEPTLVQRLVIPAIIKKHDIVASSETGSGKTASFVLPVIDNLDYDSRDIQVLVLVPTRELCLQVAEDFVELSPDLPLKVAEIYGGASYHVQRKKLSQHPQVVVGTPGRLLDLMGGGDLDFRRIKVLVFDEADRMLDMGFLPQIHAVLKGVPKKRQTLMFSATIPVEVSRFAAMCLHNPEHIQVGERARPPEHLVQEALDVMPGDKEAKLLEILAAEPGSVLVFTRTKVRADEVYRAVKNAKHSVCVLHSDRSQHLRRKAIDGFKEGKYRVMVATDVASRGLDIENISLVVNFDMPDNPEDYVHRIGRTGRAEAEGRAISFVTYKNYQQLKSIERLTGHTFKNMAPPKRMMDRRVALKRKIR